MSNIGPIEGDDQVPALFCRALYDYEAQDASALSFRRDDIIEVLMQEASGWWDGLLGNERGWFPSNYVMIISEEEAEAAFAEAEMLTAQGVETEVTVDMTQAMGGIGPDPDDWDNNAAHHAQSGANSVQVVSGPSNDFWEPQVTASGQVFFVNTRTGEQSRDLPQEIDHDAPVDDLAPLISQPASTRAGATSSLSFLNGLSPEDQEPGSAGFGLPRRSGTPEPWVRKLADDGMSYFYYNKATGMTQWTRPDTRSPNVSGRNSPSQPDTNPSVHHLRPKASDNNSQQNGLHRASVYSDDSDVQPADIFYRSEVDSTTDTLVAQSQLAHPEQPGSLRDALTDLTSVEAAATFLQESLSPPAPVGIAELSERAFAAVQGILDKLTSNAHEDLSMEHLVKQVVHRIRELLHVCAPPSNQIPNNVRSSISFDTPAQTSQVALRSSQRRVTATLSKLVLSARALEYEADATPSDTPARLKGDAEELNVVLRRFITEAQRSSSQATTPSKRIRAVFVPDGVGRGVFGGGSGGDWLGLGWAAARRDADVKILGPEVLTEVSVLLSNLDVQLKSLASVHTDADSHAGQAIGEVVVGHIGSFLVYVSKLDVARHVDLDGVGLRASQNPYRSLVFRARSLLRMLEAAVQAVFDDGAALLSALQRRWIIDVNPGGPDAAEKSIEIDRLIRALSANVFVVGQTLEALVTTGHDQISTSPSDFSHSMDWRARHMTSLHAKHQSMATIQAPTFDEEGYVGMEDAFHHAGGKSRSTAASRRQSGEVTDIPTTDDDYDDLDSHDDLDDGTLMDDEDLVPITPRRRGKGGRGHKLVQVMGEGLPPHILNNVESKPWYLRPNYDPAEIQIEPDGSIRGGSPRGLVEHLTAHDATNPTFAKAFMMSFKSFMRMDDLFELLVQRFHIQPPPKLTDAELEDWAKNKQHVIQMRVINTFKTMVTDDDVLEKEDHYIFDKIKEFITLEEVARLPAAKQLALLLERGRARKVTALNGPPPPIMPKSLKKLKLLDIDPLELARQLTIMESDLFMKIRTMECFNRSREQKAAHGDNIATVIQTSNKIADWVADQILSRDDSRKRAAVLKQFISTADRCRILHNFSTMVAITSGLNTPPIRRLKRTWEHIPPKLMSHFNSCEQVMESTKNYNSYRQAMSAVNPPCVPFIGVYLTTLQFIHDGSKDMLQGDLINFRKRQKASEVIQDIKRWQAAPFHFTPIPPVLAYLRESLDVFNAGEDVRERFWNLSLEREPREREDERMARLLQESGFL